MPSEVQLHFKMMVSTQRKNDLRLCDLGSFVLNRLIWEDFMKDLDVQEANLFLLRSRGCRSFWIWFNPNLALEEKEC